MATNSRKSLKRVFDLYDSPVSSTPPRPPAKRQHVDACPSDSPTNPFGFKLADTRALPRMIHTDEHLILRFQLATSSNNVHRTVHVPSNYTFWHLSQLVQFLFGWRDVRKVRSRSSRNQRVRHECQHLFLVQKDVVFFSNATRVGLVKGGRTVVKVAAQVPVQKSKRHDETRWEQEDVFMLQHVWPKRTESNRAVIYEYDVNTHNRQTAYITLHKQEYGKQLRRDGYSNTPLVVQGSGLPNDDDDDDDFPLDLQQWNEVDAFEDFMASQDEDSLARDTQTECSSVDMSRRLEEEQERILRTLTAPLPPDPEEERKKKKGRTSLTAKLSEPELEDAYAEEEEEYSPVPFLDEEEL